MISFFLFCSLSFAADRPLEDLQAGSPILVNGSLSLSNEMWKYHKKGQYLDQGYSFEWSQKLLKPEEGQCKVSLWKMSPGVESQEKIQIQSRDLILSETPKTNLMAQKVTKARRLRNKNWPHDYAYEEKESGYTEVSFYLPVKTKDGKREGSVSCRYLTENPPKGKMTTGLLAKKTHSLLEVGEPPVLKKRASAPSGEEESKGGSPSGF